MNIERDKKCFPLHFCPIRLNGRPDWSDITVCTKELIHASVHATYKPNVQVSNQARYHARVLRCFPDLLLAWTFYCSSDSLSTELQGHCIAREIWIHTVHHPLSPFIVQTAARPAHCRHHTILKSSLTLRAFRSGVLNHNGFFEYTEILVLTKTTIQF
jgi:hypothetical protein